MSLDDLAKWTPVITIAVGIVTIVTVVWRAAVLSQQIKQRMDRLEGRLDTLNAWASGFSKEITTFLGMIVQMLSRRQQLTDEEVGLMTRGFANINTAQVDALFMAERFSHNPLTPDELARLESYYGRLRAGQALDYSEVQDYNRLVAILQQDRPNDPGIWPLLALGAFVVGLWVGREEQR